MRIKSLVLATALACSCVIQPANAGIQGTMESIFNSMTNFSEPGVYEGIRRGVVTGGGLNIHNRIVSANLLSIAPPDWRVGCGGIDFFGGSFSFINADQFVQLMRAIAANAAGYAFSIAIDTISSTIGLNIKNLVHEIQQWVRLLNNSCAAAMVMVDGVAGQGPHWQNFKTRVERIAAAKGTSADEFSSKTKDDVVGDTVHLEETKRKLGNIVYRSMVEQNAMTWFPGGDNGSIEELMSLFGTIIVKQGEKVEGKTNVVIEPKPAVLSFRSLLEGGTNLTVYKCCSYAPSDDLEKACTEMTPQNGRTIVSLKERFEDILIGPEYRNNGIVGGVVRKYHDDSEGDLTVEEKNLMSHIGNFAVPIQQLSITNPMNAVRYIQEVMPIIAVEILYDMSLQLSKSVREAVTQSDSSYVAKALEEIEKNERSIRGEVDDMRAQYGTISKALDTYQTYRSTLLDPKGEGANSDAVATYPIRMPE